MGQDTGRACARSCIRSMTGYLAPSAKNPKAAAAKADPLPPPPKPPTKPPSADPKGLAALPAPPKAETPGLRPSQGQVKAKSKAKSISDEEKAKIPCIFHRMPNGCMCGSNCKYSHEDPKNGTSERRGDPLTKALSVQKWSHALDLFSISTQRLPDFPVSE